MKSFVVALVFALSLVSSRVSQAHDDNEPIWAMDAHERLELEESIEAHRTEFLNALEDAIGNGIDGATVQRPYVFDSKDIVADIPRSVLNRVIISSLHLELAEMRLYLSCDQSCDQSLEKDLAGDAHSAEAVAAVRRLWPKIKASFAILWRDIPTGVWLRMVHASKYSRAIGASIRYQTKAYGRISMAMGAAGFATAFGISELAESMFLGPLHLVCKANYFWSVAFGTAIASLSRDLKTLLLFQKDGKSFISRLRQGLANFRSLRSARQLEKRILFRSAVGENGIEIFKKLTKRKAQSSVLEPLLGEISASQAVASDPLLWAELISTAAIEPLRPPGSPVETLTFDADIGHLFRAGGSREEAILRWQDIASALRTILKIFRNTVDVAQINTSDRGANIKMLGELDLRLRNVDLFIYSWLADPERTDRSREANRGEQWLRHVIAEWLELGIILSGKHQDTDLRERLDHLATLVNESLRRGDFTGTTTIRFSDLGATLRTQRSTTYRCENLFRTIAK